MSNTKLQDQILLPRDPAASQEAATKQYVDGAIAVAAPTQGILVASGAAVSVSNTAVETPIQRVTIPGGVLGANGAIKVRVSGQYLNNSGATKTFTLRIYYGGTLMYAGTTGSLSSSALQHAFDLEFALQGGGATNAQSIGGTVSLSAPGGSTGLGLMNSIPTASTGVAPPALYGTASVDSTADQTLQITIQHSAASASTTFSGAYFFCAVEGVGLKGDNAAPTKDYIQGLLASYVDATHIQIGTGAAATQATGALLQLNSATSVTSLGTSGWQHVYLYDSGGAAALEISATAPASPYFGTARSKTGDTSRRYLFSALADGSGNFYQFVHLGVGGVRYLETTSVAPFRAINNSAVTVSTTLALSGVIPVSAQKLSARIANLATGAQAYFNTPDMGAVSISNYMLTSRPGNDGYYELITDASQQINYYNNASGGSLYVDVLGYEFLR